MLEFPDREDFNESFTCSTSGKGDSDGNQYLSGLVMDGTA